MRVWFGQLIKYVTILGYVKLPVMSKQQKNKQLSEAGANIVPAHLTSVTLLCWKDTDSDWNKREVATVRGFAKMFTL